jgi:hypothetical protein
MKWPSLNGVLLGVNLGLLAAAGFYLSALRPDPAPVAASEPPAAPEPPPPPEDPPPPQVVVVTNDLRWRQLESEDYKTYIARLRRIGCPEQTIRDLIIADLDTLLAPRVQGLAGRRQHLGYWHSEEEELANDTDPRERQRQERAIDQEKRQIIQELLGVDLVRQRLRQKGQEDYYERRLGFLPEEKRDVVRQVLEKYDEQEQTIRGKEWEDGDTLTAADRAQLRELQQARQAEVASVLSPAEREQFELWLSPIANAVRHDCYGMDATEQEFLAIYRLRKAFEDTWGQEDTLMMDEVRRQQWEQARQELDARVREQLGAERFAVYQRGGDEDFHHLCAAAARNQIAKERAYEAYELKATLQTARQATMADARLTDAQKERALKEMADEAERTLKSLLGDKAFRYYLRRGQGTWIRN